MDFVKDYLTHEELVFLTGYEQKKRQVNWLRDHRWKHETSGQGDVLVLRSYRDERLGKVSTYTRRKKTPRFDLM